MNNTDKKIELLHKIFDEEKRRTEIEQQAEAVFMSGNPQKAIELFQSIDDSILLGLRAELVALNKEER